MRSRQPPPNMAPLAESSCTVTATGKLDVITVPVAWSEAPDPEARPEYVEPANGKLTSKGMPAGCPMRSCVGVTVTTGWLPSHDVEPRGCVEAVVREVLEGQVKGCAQGVDAFQCENVGVVDVAYFVIRGHGGRAGDSDPFVQNLVERLVLVNGDQRREVEAVSTRRRDRELECVVCVVGRHVHSDVSRDIEGGEAR